MKMTERIGPGLSGKNHRGFRYTPKQVVKQGQASYSTGHCPLSHAELEEMVTEFRRETGRDPEVLYHSGLMHSQIQVFAPRPAPGLWLRQVSGQEACWLE